MTNDKNVLRQWLTPDGFVSAAKVIVALIVAMLLVANRDHVSAWMESVSHLEIGGFKLDRARAAEVLFDLKVSDKSSTARFTKTDEAEVEALGERLGPSLVGARILWIDPHPENNVAMQRFLELFGIKSELVLDSKSAVAMLYGGMDVDLIVTSSRAGEPLFRLPSDDAEPRFQDPSPAGYKAPLRNCPVFLLSNEGWLAQSDTIVGALEFIEWTRQTSKWSHVPVILYSASMGGSSSGPCMETTNVQPDFVRKVFFLLADARASRLVRNKPCSGDACTANSR